RCRSARQSAGQRDPCPPIQLQNIQGFIMRHDRWNNAQRDSPAGCNFRMEGGAPSPPGRGGWVRCPAKTSSGKVFSPTPNPRRRQRGALHWFSARIARYILTAPQEHCERLRLDGWLVVLPDERGGRAF